MEATISLGVGLRVLGYPEPYSISLRGTMGFRVLGFRV